MPYFTTYSPKHRVIFKDLPTGLVKCDVSDDLLSLSTNKAYGRAAGTWQLMLTYKITTSKNYDIDPPSLKTGRYHELIAPNDVITIEMDAGNGQGMKPVMLGLVDRISVTRAGGPNPNRQVKISGRDMGKVLEEGDIGIDINAHDVTLIPDGFKHLAASVEERLALEEGTPSQLFTLLVQIFNKKNSTSGKYLDYQVTTTDPWILLNKSFPSIEGVPMWGALQECSHRVRNMLHTETLSIGEADKFLVLLEQAPYDSDGYVNRSDALTHTITDDEIIADDLGISDAELINFLQYLPTQVTSYDKQAPIAIADRRLIEADLFSIDMHGYRPKRIRDDFVSPLKKGLDDTKQICSASITNNTVVSPYEEMKNYLWGWYGYNETLWSGSMTLHLRPDIKTGERLLVPIEGRSGWFMEYLVEQVAHQYHVWPSPTFQTTLHLTRGQEIKENGAEERFDLIPSKIAPFTPIKVVPPNTTTVVCTDSGTTTPVKTQPAIAREKTSSNQVGINTFASSEEPRTVGQISPTITAAKPVKPAPDPPGKMPWPAPTVVSWLEKFYNMKTGDELPVNKADAVTWMALVLIFDSGRRESVQAGTQFGTVWDPEAKVFMSDPRYMQWEYEELTKKSSPPEHKNVFGVKQNLRSVVIDYINWNTYTESKQKQLAGDANATDVTSLYSGYSFLAVMEKRTQGAMAKAQLAWDVYVGSKKEGVYP